MNIAPDINNHLKSIDLLRLMIIKNNRSKVRDGHASKWSDNLQLPYTIMSKVT